MLQPGFFPQAGWIIFSNSNRQNDASLVPRSSRLAAKNKKRVVKPEIQARNVLLEEVVSLTPRHSMSTSKPSHCHFRRPRRELARSLLG